MPKLTAAPLLDRLARAVTRRRALVLVPTVLIAVALGIQIPNIEADPTPEKLLASYAEEQAGGEEVFEKLAETDDVIVVLLEAQEVLEPRKLQYLHTLARAMEGREWASRVRSITTMPLPRFEEAASGDLESLQDLEDLDGGGGQGGSDGPTLEELEEPGGGGDGPTLEELEEPGGGGDGPTLEELEQGDTGPGSPGEVEAGDPEMLDALSDLVDAAPERFPAGLGGLAARLEGQLETDPVVEGDEVTEAEAEELQRVLADASLVEGRLVSKDRTVAVVVLQLDIGEDRHETVTTAIDALRDHLESHEPPEGAEVHIGGLPYLRSSIVQKMKTDRRVLMPLTVFICLLILYLSYRWLAGTLLPMIAVGMTTVVVVGGMAVFGAQMNVLTNIIPPLLVIIGICESIHLVGRYREELAKGDGRVEAGERTVRTMAVACFLASLTTAIGLGSLVVSGSEMLRAFGIIAGLGVMVAYVVTVTFLPSVLSAVPKPKHIEQTERRGLERVIVLLTQGVLRAPWTIVAATAVLLGFSIWGATNLDVDHALLDQFDEDDPVYKTTRLMENKLEGIRPLELRVSAQDEGALDDPELLASLDEIEQWAQGQPEVISTMGPGDILHETWSMLVGQPKARQEKLVSEKQVDALRTLLTQREQSPLNAFVTEDGKHARVQLRLKDVGAKKTLKFIDELDAKVHGALEEHSGVEVSYAGDAYTGSKSLNAVVTDLLGSLLVAIAIIFVLLTVLLRSFRLGLLSIPSNVIPLIVTMAYMVVRGIPLNAATVIIFSISIGLAVDSTIHVLARYREETLGGLGSSQALLRAARGTGQAIVVSNLTLMAGFAVLTFSSFVPVRNFGELIAVTVGGCLVATLVVQPALLKIAGLPRRAELEAASL